MPYQEVIKAIDKILKANDDDLEKLLESEGFINPKSTVENMNDFEDTISDLLEEEYNHFSSGIDPSSPLKDNINYLKQDLLAADTLAAGMSTAAKNIFELTILELTKAYMESIDPDVALAEVFSKRTTDFIEEWSAQLGEIMQLSSHEMMENILNKALEDGDSIEDVIANLETSYGFSRKRARRTAITEILRAHSYSKDEAFLQSPAVVEVEWKHSGGKGINPRPHHVALDGTTIKKGGLFTLSSTKGTYTARFPRDVNLPPSEAVECHCTTAGIVDQDILGLSKKEKEALRDEAIAEADKIYGAP